MGSKKFFLKILCSMRCLKIRQAELAFTVAGVFCNETDPDTHILNHSDDDVIVGGFSLRANKH
jgi:hypothetical protein